MSRPLFIPDWGPCDGSDPYSTFHSREYTWAELLWHWTKIYVTAFRIQYQKKHQDEIKRLGLYRNAAAWAGCSDGAGLAWLRGPKGSPTDYVHSEGACCASDVVDGVPNAHQACVLDEAETERRIWYPLKGMQCYFIHGEGRR